MKQKIYVIDTNIILQNINNIVNLSDKGTNIVVVPETVLLELEDKKKLFNELGYHSRSFARYLAKAKILKIDHKKNAKIVKLLNQDDNVELHIISKDTYETQMEQHNLSESNDKRIIEVAEFAKEYYKGLSVTFVSIDIYARTFALFKNLKTESLHDDRADVPEFEFIKSIPLDSSHFNRLNLKPIAEFDPHHVIENFCYEFVSDDGNVVYAIVINEQIHMIDESDFNALAIKPSNLKQKFFLAAILSNMFNLLVIDAKAGSGKTLMSIVSAMRLIDIGQYEKIVYVRNSIESLEKGAEVGFLAGNEEKFRIYNMALYDTLEFVSKKKLRNTQNKENKESIESKTHELIEKYNIEMLWPGEARGRTLSGAIVIMDE